MLLLASLLGCSAGSDDTSTDGPVASIRHFDPGEDWGSIGISAGSPFVVQTCNETGAGTNCRDASADFYTLAGRLCYRGSEDPCLTAVDDAEVVVVWWE